MIETLTELRIEKNDDAPCDVACFVLLTDNKNFNIGTPSYALDLLGKPTYEFEVAFRKQYGEGYTGKSATSAEIENGRTGSEVRHFPDSHRVEHMVLVEVVDVFT